MKHEMANDTQLQGKELLQSTCISSEPRDLEAMVLGVGKTVYVVFKYLSRSLLWTGMGEGGVTHTPLPHSFSQQFRGYHFKTT
jgi:hypothetical protein